MANRFVKGLHAVEDSLAVLAVFALAALLAPLVAGIAATETHDLGKLLFAFVVFWAYIAFSQFMLIWYGNIPEETGWFLRRQTHGWEWIGLTLVFGHFVLPFVLLLSRSPKRRPKVLGLAAAWVLLMHLVDVYWLALPAWVWLDACQRGEPAQIPLLIISFQAAPGHLIEQVVLFPLLVDGDGSVLFADLLLAQVVEAEIGDDAVNPRVEGALKAKIANALVRLQERVLDDVLGIFAVLRDVLRDPKDVPVVAADQLFKSRVVTFLRRPYQRQLFANGLF